MKYRLAFISSMVIFGTIGAFVRLIPLPSGEIALFRGILGSLSIIALIFLSGRKPGLGEIRKNIRTLAISGAFLAGNWIFLFEGYKSAPIAVVSLLYYTAPALVLAFSMACWPRYATRA